VITAITGRDVPLVGGIVLVASTAYVLINVGVDLLYRLIDPRLRGREGRGAG
jgi:peptide/nickel transport system permease protein